jgi:hypothetical protein
MKYPKNIINSFLPEILLFNTYGSSMSGIGWEVYGKRYISL